MLIRDDRQAGKYSALGTKKWGSAVAKAIYRSRFVEKLAGAVERRQFPSFFQPMNHRSGLSAPAASEPLKWEWDVLRSDWNNL
jgi:hypothetical protein